MRLQEPMKYNHYYATEIVVPVDIAGRRSCPPPVGDNTTFFFVCYKAAAIAWLVKEWSHPSSVFYVECRNGSTRRQTSVINLISYRNQNWRGSLAVVRFQSNSLVAEQQQWTSELPLNHIAVQKQWLG